MRGSRPRPSPSNLNPVSFGHLLPPSGARGARAWREPTLTQARDSDSIRLAHTACSARGSQPRGADFQKPPHCATAGGFVTNQRLLQSLFDFAIPGTRQTCAQSSTPKAGAIGLDDAAYVRGGRTRIGAHEPGASAIEASLAVAVAKLDSRF
jgi:hypothetical protein